ncbi:c-type cytochrome [Synechococcus sp. PCC 7336]|uniref:c-type cytochrome n=1 Tax=Synechococcus sp. PCC 7336 TaxID=195250 RepID=UPI00034A1550|nr:c-type cytochrome [Synechococcus sp. PCC 7336]
MGIVLLLGTLLYFGIGRWHQPDSYTLAVLQLTGDPAKGETLFAMNCAGCHGTTAEGHVGPSLHGVTDRRSDIALIEQVTSGKTLPMPQFQPEPEAMADLLSYLKTLSPRP